MNNNNTFEVHLPKKDESLDKILDKLIEIKYYEGAERLLLKAKPTYSNYSKYYEKLVRAKFKLKYGYDYMEAIDGS